MDWKFEWFCDHAGSLAHLVELAEISRSDLLTPLCSGGRFWLKSAGGARGAAADQIASRRCVTCGKALSAQILGSRHAEGRAFGAPKPRDTRRAKPRAS